MPSVEVKSPACHHRPMQRLTRHLLGWLVSGGAWFLAAPAAADPAAADAPPKNVTPVAIEHGSGKGAGDSRGAGEGDGRGRRQEGPAHGAGEGTGTALGRGEGDGRGVGATRLTASGPAPPPAASNERPPLAIDVSDDIQLVPSLSYQLRYYHREGRDFVEGNVQNYLRHRARLGLGASYRSLASVFIQLQDVRTFGEESDPTNDYSADGFDLHQGYLTLSPTEHVHFRLGRQEVVLANERLVGVPQFLEQARSFDGLHFSFDQQVELQAGYFLVRDYSVGVVEPGLANGKHHLGIAHLGYAPFEPFHPHVLGIFDGDTATDRLVVTAGGLVTGSVGKRVALSYSGEGYYQGGKQGDTNVSAWLVALSTRVTLDHEYTPFAEVHGVLVSGDDDPDDPTQRTFASPYPRGHRIHGEMDFFINFPNDTSDRGLRDFGGTIGWAPKKVAMTGAFHFFDAMATRPDGLRHFGFESDFKIAYPFWEYASIDTLYGFFVPGEIKRVGLNDPRVEHFVYATAKVGF